MRGGSKEGVVGEDDIGHIGGMLADGVGEWK